MGLEAAEVAARRYRRPWYQLVLLGIAAAIATWLVFSNAQSRVAQNDRQFASSQIVRLQSMKIGIDDYFSKAIQLVAAGAQTLGPVHGDRALAKRLVAELFASRRTPKIYGLGPFYVPGAFDGKNRLFAIYDEVAPGGGLRQIVSTAHAGDYTRYRWYRRGLAGRGNTVFAGPYWENHKSFISTLQAFYRNGRPAGVMAVDTLTQTFKSIMASALVPGDIGWIESSGRRHWLLGTRPLPHDRSDRIDRYSLLRYSGAYVHLSTNAGPLRAADKRIALASVGLAIVIWLLAGISALGLRRNWRAHEATLALELERARLEHEIAVGKKVEAELRRAAYTDALTGLPNRTPFLNRVSTVLHPWAGDRLRHAIFFIDLDRFSLINDTLGHVAGDDLLKVVAGRLRARLPQHAMVARLGGDEFVVVFPVDREDDVERSSFALLDTLREPVVLRGHTIHATGSIGIVAVDAGYARPDELLRDAEIAVYEAKRLGRDRYAVFDAAMRSRVNAELELENDLRRAISVGEFAAHYQPWIAIATGEIASFEALVRWNRPGRGLVGADDFISFAETRGFVAAIDDLMLGQVCGDASALFARFPNSTLAINVSATHLGARKLPETIATALESHGIPPRRVKIEITETAVMTNATRAQETLERLRDIGLEIVLDDFGQGHSSLAYLQRLPIAGVKIDRSFVEPLLANTQSLAIVRSIVALAHTLGLYTVAEGVETSAQLEALRSLGVVYAQGFLFAPARGLAGVLAGEERWTA